MRIEDYAIIGDSQTAALVGRDGSIDWLCLPRFDSGACFAALLGDRLNGRWLLAPAGGTRRINRRYVDDTLALETTFEGEDGVVRVTDFMPPREQELDVVRIVEGVRGRVPMRMELVIRFEYGSVKPWVRSIDGRLEAIAGPDAVHLDTPIETCGRDHTTVGEFFVQKGDRVPFVLTWYPSHTRPPEPVDGVAELARTLARWRAWSANSTFRGPRRDLVMRSLIVLKALTYAPTGGIVAAPTTSLPEDIGGVRNWDYRYCWMRDATFTLDALLLAGYRKEAQEWRDWLLRAVGGEPGRLQIMYGPAGERSLPEREIDWLAGYEGSRPVRVGNAASLQRQLDVHGELLNTMFDASRAGIEGDERAWDVQRALLDHLESSWREPDEGIWEVRGPRRHFTHSKVMAWVAFDRAIRSVDAFQLDGPVDSWRAARDEVHVDVCRNGYDAERGAFVQSYGSKRLDASLLMMPLVGFLSVDDDRVASTIGAIERELVVDGFVHRYDADCSLELDGLSGAEGAFLPCTLWLADNYLLLGRRRHAQTIIDCVSGVANDVGLLAEEYDTSRRRLAGNFPQAFSHVSLVNTLVQNARRDRGDRPSLTDGCEG